MGRPVETHMPLDMVRRVLEAAPPSVVLVGGQAPGIDAARKNADRYGIHLADAVPAWRIDSSAFWSQQWPNVRALMSPAYAALCEQRAGQAR